MLIPQYYGANGTRIFVSFCPHEISKVFAGYRYYHTLVYTPWLFHGKLSQIHENSMDIPWYYSGWEPMDFQRICYSWCVNHENFM